MSQLIFRKSTEERLNDLESRVNKLESALSSEIGWYEAKAELGAPSPKRRGPKERISTAYLLSSRDGWVAFLERHWPELKVILRTARSAQDLAMKMTVYEQGSEAEYVWKLRDNFDLLRAFLDSSDYRGNPRNLANAIAGAPALTWQTSFRRCRDHQCEDLIGKRAVRDYLRRRYHKMFKRLLKAKNPVVTKSILTRSRSKDPNLRWLRNNAVRVPEILTSGTAIPLN